MTPSGYLLDVNFLVALAWPNHTSHAEARAWFRKPRDVPFATCPITESGFVRISMNPLVVGAQVSLPAALELLAQYRTKFSHLFWVDDLALGSALTPFSRISGHRQVTDAYLVALAASQGGTLVTFDSGLATLCPAELRDQVLLVR